MPTQVVYEWRPNRYAIVDSRSGQPRSAQTALTTAAVGKTAYASAWTPQRFETSPSKRVTGQTRTESATVAA